MELDKEILIERLGQRIELNHIFLEFKQQRYERRI